MAAAARRGRRRGTGLSASSDISSSEPVSAGRSWRATLLVEEEPGRRNRRTLDALLTAIAAFVVGLAAVLARSAPDVDDEISAALITVLGWAPGVWRVAITATVILAVVVSVDGLVRRRWLLVRDLLFALVAVNALAIVLARTVDSEWVQVEPHPFSSWGFPELRIACVAAVFAVARADLVEPARKIAFWLLGLSSVGVVALDIALPSQMLGGLALGLGTGALVRFALGSPLGVPTLGRVHAAVAALGPNVSELRISERQRVGSAEFFGRDESGGEVKVRVLGRDAQDTQRFARRWRLLAYRDPPRSAPIGRLEQVEHEALATLMAAHSGVRVPHVLAVGLGPEDDAVLVTQQPDAMPLELWIPDDITDELLEELWRQVGRLHLAGIAHGRLNLSNVIAVDGEPMLVNLAEATLGAPQASLDIDVAELLVACAVLVGPERTLSKAVDAGWGGSIARVLPYLQRAALTPHTRDLARSNEIAIKELREAAAVATGTALPEIAPLRRVTAKGLVTMAALVFAAYLVVTQLADIGFTTIYRELETAEPVWVLIALLLAQAAFIGSGVSVRGAVRAPLALLPCVVLQSAIKFVNLTVPSSAGRIGMNLRFLQRMGVPRGEALAAGAVDDVSETMVQVALLLLALPFVGATVDTSQLHGPDTRLIAGIAVALIVSGLVVLAIPKMRAKVVPGVKGALSGLWAVARSPRKLAELFGGNIGSELLYATALGATCLAYGAHLNLAELVFVNTSAAILSSLIPVPGGIGAAEAALSAGLIAMGVDESTAFAIAITQRLCTFYLPPIWGYFSLRWLGRNGYV